MNKPIYIHIYIYIYIVYAILDDSKVLIYHIYYNYMIPRWSINNFQLFYMDTGSLNKSRLLKTKILKMMLRKAVTYYEKRRKIISPSGKKTQK